MRQTERLHQYILVLSAGHTLRSQRLVLGLDPVNSLHTIEATEEMKSLSLAEIHRQFTVSLRKGEVTLIRAS